MRVYKIDWDIMKEEEIKESVKLFIDESKEIISNMYSYTGDSKQFKIFNDNFIKDKKLFLLNLKDKYKEEILKENTNVIVLRK